MFPTFFGLNFLLTTCGFRGGCKPQHSLQGCYSFVIGAASFQSHCSHITILHMPIGSAVLAHVPYLEHDDSAGKPPKWKSTRATVIIELYNIYDL